MGKEERIVVLLAKYFLSKVETKELNTLLNEYLNWPKVIGYLSGHRIMGIAWATVKKYHFDIEGRKHSWQKFFSILKENNILLRTKQNEQISSMSKIYNSLERENVSYAALKGIALLYFAYDFNITRDFNDNDILISLLDSEKVISISRQLGYEYGKKSFVTDGILHPKRKKVIARTMATHELFPLIKQIPNSFIGHHIIDFQFSLDLYSKNRTEDLVNTLLNQRKNISTSTFSFYSLDLEDTLIFTLVHFYKEAIYERKILDYKDLALYKLCDINFLLHNPEINIEKLISRINSYKLNKPAYFALFYLKEVFGESNTYLINQICTNLNDDFLSEYFNDDMSWKSKWIQTVNERLFDFNRANYIYQKGAQSIISDSSRGLDYES